MVPRMVSINSRNALIALALLTSSGAVWSIDPAPSVSTAASAKTTPKSTLKSGWASLNPTQQQALAPLAGEWDQLELFRKQKWLEIANRFPSMKPEEQQRMQERMREWTRLTPEQRRVVRENYARSTRIDPSQKSAQWEQYQQLTEDQKKKLAADAPARKRVANLPSAAQSKTPLLPPIKSGSAKPAAAAAAAAAPTPATVPGQAAPTQASDSVSTPDAASISPPTVNSAPSNAK
jgi:hypothetical protein